MAELEGLERQMKGKLENGDARTDMAYWGALLELLKGHMARKRIKVRDHL